MEACDGHLERHAGTDADWRFHEQGAVSPTPPAVMEAGADKEARRCRA